MLEGAKGEDINGDNRSNKFLIHQRVRIYKDISLKGEGLMAHTGAASR
jgi:hypothetical protein